MRGGTANCSVTVSDEPIGSPVFENNIDIVIAMNLPSYLKYVDKVAPGGCLFLNSSIIDEEVKRTDINVYRVPVNDIADETILGSAFINLFGEAKKKLIPANTVALGKGAESVKDQIK